MDHHVLTRCCDTGVSLLDREVLVAVVGQSDGGMVRRSDGSPKASFKEWRGMLKGHGASVLRHGPRMAGRRMGKNFPQGRKTCKRQKRGFPKLSFGDEDQDLSRPWNAERSRLEWLVTSPFHTDLLSALPYLTNSLVPHLEPTQRFRKHARLPSRVSRHVRTGYRGLFLSCHAGPVRRLSGSKAPEPMHR